MSDPGFFLEPALAALRKAKLLNLAARAEAGEITPAVVVTLNSLVAQALDNEALAKNLAEHRDAAKSALVRDAAEVADDPARWRQAVAAALDCGLYDQVAEIVGLARPSNEQAAVASGVEFALRRRWRESAPLFERLGAAVDVDPKIRSHMLATRALIDIRVVRDADGARARIDAAEALAPDQWETVYARASLVGMPETPEADSAAEAEYQRADSLAQGKAASPLTELGSLMLKRGNLARAEQCFQEASRAKDTPGDGYGGLIELAGHAQLFADRCDRIPELVERARLLALSIANEVDAMLAAATAMAKNKDEAAAATWFEQAIARDPRRIDGLLQRGNGALERKDFTAARADFVRAGQVAPDSAEVDWAFVQLAEAASDWDAVLEHSMSAMRRAPEWAEAITGRLEETAKKLYGPAPQLSETILNRLRGARGGGYEAEYRNLIGNLRYWQSDYGAAADSYRAAVAQRPDVAQYSANLTMALEQTAKSDGRYDEALEAVAVALTIEPGNAEYTALRDRLLTSSRFVDRYGSAAQRLLPDTYRINVLVPRSLLPQVAKDGSLLPELQKGVSVLRDALQRGYGFVLCGVNFRELQPADNPQSTLIIEIGGERVLERQNVGPDTNLMSVLAQVIRARLPLAFGHEEARACAKACPEHTDMEDDPAQLNGLTHAIRLWLADHDDLPDDALAEVVRGAEPLRPQIERTTACPVPSLLLLHAPDVTVPDDIFSELQANVFRRTGVVLPLLPHEATADHPAGTLRLSIGESAHELPVEDPWPVAVHLLAARAADLFGPDALSFGMQHLREAAPALVTVAESLLPGDALRAKLQRCLRDGRSIINLRTTLEQTLLPPLSVWSFTQVQ